jgi:hypothetical protein
VTLPTKSKFDPQFDLVTSDRKGLAVVSRLPDAARRAGRGDGRGRPPNNLVNAVNDAAAAAGGVASRLHVSQRERSDGEGRLMGIFDIFTNDNADAARNAQIGGLNAGNTAATGNINAGIGALNSNYTQALQPFLTNFNTPKVGCSSSATCWGSMAPAATRRR